jgi:hypothetical protein
MPAYDIRASLRIIAATRDAGVYVDGFYAGVVDDFDGNFQRLHLTPGGHEIVMYLAGYRTERHHVYLGPGSSLTLRITLEHLEPGDVSERPTFAPPVPPPPHGSYREPRRPAHLPPAEIVTVRPFEAAGTLDLHVQPDGTRVEIDGHVWASSNPQHFVIDLKPGPHRLRISKEGYQTYIAEILIRDDETTAMNVSLTKGS